MMRGLTWVLASLPLAAFASAVLLAAAAWAIQGHWPYYAHPDPKELVLPGALMVVTGLLVGAFSSVLLYPAVMVPCAVGRPSSSAGRANAWRRPTQLFVLGLALWLIEGLIRGDTGLLVWLMD